MGSEAGAERPGRQPEGDWRPPPVKKQPVQESRAKKWREASPAHIAGAPDPAAPEGFLPRTR